MKEQPKSRVVVMKGKSAHSKEQVFYDGHMALPRLRPMEGNGHTIATLIRSKLEEEGKNIGIFYEDVRFYVNGVVLSRSAMGQSRLAHVNNDK